MGRRPTLRITGPVLGQVEVPVDEGVAPGGNIGGEDTDLAVGDLARRAGILPADAVPCFKKPVSSMTSTASPSASVSSA